MPFTQPSFVGRETLLAEYRETISRYAQGEESHAILNLHAMTGMGKTWFARRLFEDAGVRRQCACAWLSFEPGASLPGDASGVLSLTATVAFEELLKQATPPDKQAPGLQLPPALADLPVGFEFVPGPSERMVVFLDALNMIEQRLDAATSEEAWDALQEQVISRLLEWNRLVLAISQGPLVWTLWELNQAGRSGLRPLPPFEPGETARLAERYGLESSAGLIQELTFGHPSSITAIIRHHLEPDARPPLDWPALATPEQELRQRIERLDASTQRAIWRIGVVRFVDVGTIRALLERLELIEATGKSQPFHELLTALSRQGLVTRDPAGKIYRFDPGLRVMVRRELRRPENLEEFSRICDTLVDWYLPQSQMPGVARRHAILYPDNLVEWAYFLLNGLNARVIAGETRPEDANRWQNELPAVWRAIEDPDRRQAFGNALLNDPEVRDLLESLGLHRITCTELGRDLDLQQEHAERYLRIAYDALVSQRLTHRIADRDVCVLALLARRADGFDRDDLAHAVKEVYGTHPAPQQVRAYLALFSQAFAIAYRSDTRRFVVNEWLQQFLTRLVDKGVVSMGG